MIGCSPVVLRLHASEQSRKKNRRGRGKGEESKGKETKERRRRAGLATASQLADLEASVTVLRVHSPGRALCPFIGTH